MTTEEEGNRSLPPIQGLWIGDQLPRIAALSIRSFLEAGHPFHLFTYAPLSGVPEGTTLREAEEILPSHQIFKPFCQFADWFRYLLLYRQGGWWSDLDVICLRPLNFNQECVLGWQDSSLINNALMFFPPGHGIVRELSSIGYSPNSLVEFDTADRRREKQFRNYRWPKLADARKNIPWAETAPTALTEAVTVFGMTRFVRPSKEFYPVHWSQWEDLFNGRLCLEDSCFKAARTIHLWNELLSRSPLRMQKTYEQNSIVEHCMKKYGI